MLKKKTVFDVKARNFIVFDARNIWAYGMRDLRKKLI